MQDNITKNNFSTEKSVETISSYLDNYQNTFRIHSGGSADLTIDT